MKIFITAKAKSTPAKAKNKDKLKRYWSLIYDKSMVDGMTAKVDER